MVALFFPPPFGAPPVTSIAFRTSATGTGQTIACPTVQSNEVIVFCDLAINGAGAPSNAVPSGFTQLQTSNGTFTRNTMSYKLADGSESGATLTGMIGDATAAKIVLVFQPAGVIATVTTSTFLQQSTDGNPAAQTISASGQPAPLIRLAVASVGGFGTAPNFSAGTFDATVAQNGVGDGGFRVGYAVQNSSPSDDAPDMADSGTSGNCLMSGWIRFS
jgi:hypothetical protein